MKPKALGTGTRNLLLRSAGLYAVVFLLGLALAHFSPWPAFGLGLVLPGGGFAYWSAGESWHFAIHAALPVLAFSIFALSLLLWFATGNALAPPSVWLALAITAQLMDHDLHWEKSKWFIPSLAIILLLGFQVAFAARVIFGNRSLARNKAHKTITAVTLKASREISSKPPELSLADLQLFRTLYDRALQPLDKFEGFNHLDQYQTAALRYQLNLAGYALAMFQHTHAPAFKGYLYQAQHNLIVKNLDHRVWKFWQRENLWGNLENNPDPCGRDNIMFTGFLATQIAMFQAASGETPFNAKASLTFKHPSGHSFEHDTQTLTETLLHNFNTARLGLMACEPNWVYPLCNTIGAAALAHFAPIEWSRYQAKFAHSLLTEFRDPSGNFVPCRSTYTGLALPSVGGAVGQAFPCFFLNSTHSHIAEDHWLALRGRMFANGRLNTRQFWPVDVGNYGFSRASSYAASAAAAQEMGDTELAQALLQALNQECPATVRDGIRHRKASSFWAHSAEALAIASRHNALQTLLTKPNPSGPKLDQLTYPDVLVASAHHKAGAIEAVLYPGAGPKRVNITAIGLEPLQTYLVDTSAIKADENGRLNFTFHLSDRKLLQIRKQV